jgi:hypothetical protein
MKEKVFIAIDGNKEWLKELKKIALEKDKTLGQLTREIIDEWIENHVSLEEK